MRLIHSSRNSRPDTAAPASDGISTAPRQFRQPRQLTRADITSRDHDGRIQKGINSIAGKDLEYIHQRFHNKMKMADATVLITGCAGFLGYYFMHYLACYAEALNIKRIIGLDNFITGDKKWLAALADQCARVEIHSFDVNRDDFNQIPGADSADYIMHMASIASPHFYRRYPIETLEANVTGLQKLLKLSMNSGKLKGFLMFSSSEIYGDPPAEHIPTEESYRGHVACIGPRACYDESKRFCETLCYLYAQQYQLPLTLVRPFNNYGPGMSPADRRLPADLARAVLDNQDIIIHSDGTPTRAFCYVADAIAGYLQALTYGQFEVFNIGRDDEISVKAMAEIYARQARRLLGYSGTIHFQPSADQDYLTDNPNRRSPVIAKARRLLGYNPIIDAEQGVSHYLAFLQEANGN